MALKESMEYFIGMYKDKYCYDLLEWCKEGKSIEAWAASINIIPDVIPIWMRMYQGFDVCVRVAYWKSYAYWDNLALEDTQRPFKEKTLNPQIYLQVMRQRFKFVDTKEDIMKELALMDDDELENRARAILDAPKSNKQKVIINLKDDDDED